MSLLRDIQDAAIDANTDISVVLRKCKVLAARLGNEEFKLWVERELNGYSSKGEVPKYRILKVQSFGHFSGVAGSGIKNAPIPPSCLPKTYREYVNTEYLMDSISYYLSLMKDRDSGSGNFQVNWPADLVAEVGGDIIQYMNCVSAWKIIPVGAIASLLDTVRNRILSFVLEIEAEAPDAGEASPATAPIPTERVTQVFNNIILGNVDTFTAGSQIISQNIEITVKKNDLASLHSFLKSIGIGQQDLGGLDKAIKEDAKSEKQGDVGNNVNTWIEKMKKKAENGAWSIATAVAAQLLVKAILLYYGYQT